MKPTAARRYRRSRHTPAAESSVFRKDGQEPAFFDTPAAAPFFSPAPAIVQRKCDHCEKEQKNDSTSAEEKKEEDGKVHRKEANAGGNVSAAGIAGALSGGGQALPAGLNQFFSSRIGYAFDSVKIHTDAKAAQSARSIHARAYTYGGHIAFAPGQYQPDTQEGRKLIAHELTHVVQQRSGSLSPALQRAPDKKDELQKGFKISIKKGDKDWTDAEIAILNSALSRLAGDEKSVVRDYQFIRWSTKEARAKGDPSYKDPAGDDECALHEMDLAAASYKISVYDACFSDPEAKSDTAFGIDKGEFHIMHEIGHAMEHAELRKTYEAYDAANKAYNDYVEKNKGKNITKAMEAEADRLTKVEEAAKKAMDDATGRALKEFTALMSGKDAITKYGEEGHEESFAEMFAAFKANPELVRKNYPEVHAWLVGKGFLKKIVKNK